jgi:hypothetical protein
MPNIQCPPIARPKAFHPSLSGPHPYFSIQTPEIEKRVILPIANFQEISPFSNQ